MMPYFFVSATLSLGYGSIYTLLAPIRDRFGFSDADVGLIAGLGFFAGFLAQVGLSRYSDRGHAALMVRAGILIAVAGLLLTIVASNLTEWLAARFLLGLGSGIVGPAVRRVIIAREPERVGVNLGAQGAIDVAGFVIGPLLAAGLYEAFGLRAPFVMLAVIDLVMLVWSGRLDLSSGEFTNERRLMSGLLKMPAMQSALCAAIAFYVTLGMFEALWSVLLDDLGASTILTGITLAVFTIPMVVLAPYGGRLAQDRGPLRVIVWSILVASLCTLSYGWLPLWGVLGVSIVHAMADSFTMPGNQVAVAISTPRDRLASGQGLLGAVGLLVAGITGAVGGAVYDEAGRRVVFTGAGVVMIAFLLAARWRGSVSPALVGAEA
jgi:MFS family permease